MRPAHAAATRDLDARVSAPPELDAGSRRRRLTRGFAFALLALAGIVTWTVVRSQMPPGRPDVIVASPPSATAPEPEPPTQPASQAATSESAAQVPAVDPGRPPSSAGVAPLPPEPPKPAATRKKRRKPKDTDLSIEIPEPPAE